MLYVLSLFLPKKKSLVRKPPHRTPPARPRPQRVQTSFTRFALKAMRMNRTDIAMDMPTVRAVSRTKTAQDFELGGMAIKPLRVVNST